MKGIFEIVNREDSESPRRLERVLADIPLEVDLDDRMKIDPELIVFKVTLGGIPSPEHNEYWEIYPDKYKTKRGKASPFTGEIYAVRHTPDGSTKGDFTFVACYSPVPPKLGACLEFSFGGFDFGLCCKRLEENKTT